ncbi:MAG: phasin family protein, partial [Alphaproteobacteria bacterium]|nr:phasin family protein [Alphaproteobacteria bacterium]
AGEDAPKSIKASVETGQVLVAFTSVDEAIDSRGKMISVAFDSLVAQGTKMTELSLKTANEGWAAVQDQIQNAFAAAKPAST